MPARVPVRTHILSSSQLATRLRISKKTLDRMIKAGRIPKPNRFPENNWRFWTLQDAAEIEDMLKELKEKK
jgi:predicted DNA-binding transcriptional regulator AlpA